MNDDSAESRMSRMMGCVTLAAILFVIAFVVGVVMLIQKVL